MQSKFVLPLSIIFISLIMIGCNGTNNDNDPLPPTDNNGVVKSSINGRDYYLSPPNEGIEPNKAYKLLLAFHGSGGSAKGMQAMTKLATFSKDYIVVYPQSKVEEWNEGCDCNKPHRLGINDLAFVEDVVTDVKQKFNIINEELYAVGYSQGGLFTQNLMCNSNLQFKGLVSVASPMSEQLSLSCQVQHSTNYMMVHGTADKTLPYQGLVHSNFGLIGSELAIDLIAKQNGIDTEREIVEQEGIQEHVYQNDTNINKLVAIQSGQHSWQFSDFDTSIEVIDFFDSVSDKQLDSFSSVYRVEQSQQEELVHVRSMGLEHTGPAVILLSGFNKNYHSDSAWFALLQPLIAKTHRVHVIERFGNGFSSDIAQPSYSSFVGALDKTLLALNEERIVMLSFSSSNILAHLWQQMPDKTSQSELMGMLWVDPDILLPHSISFYQDWPVTWYRGLGDELLNYISAGKMTASSADKLSKERLTVETLIPAKYSELMDWQYFDLISQNRLKINKQITRAKEIMNYHDDLELVRQSNISTAVPISVIDTDFEQNEIDNAEPEYIDGLIKWQSEGSQWSQQLSEQSLGQYIPLTNSDHMAVFQRPDEIVNAINFLIQ
ncbi:alpha/beta hydrolase [Thalassotalea hakodatensis]|uniref:alpha/beta hydrolase n=1 Tax=Thalassotalea hakodatensis TaxID=3030492 RepID=UPI002573D62B|nr:alpha/beta hydrolase [Thalassotalea hakodatensis]